MNKTTKSMLLLASLVGSAVAPVTAAAVESQPHWLIVLNLARPELQDLKNWTDKDNAAVGAHFARIAKMAEEGRVIFSGRTRDATGGGLLAPDTMGMIVLEAPDRAAAELVLRDDPAVLAGLMKGKVYSYEVLLQRK